jgi:hypothetical protein
LKKKISVRKKYDVALKFYFKFKNPRGSATWRFCLPRGDSVIVSCHGVHLGGGNPEKKIFARGKSQRNFFQGGKPECAYFAGGKHLFTL